MKAKIESGYEVFGIVVFMIAQAAVIAGKALKKSAEAAFLFVFGFLDRAEEVFVKIYPGLAFFSYLFLLYAFAGHEGPISEFWHSIFVTTVVYLIITLFYLYIRERSKRRR